MTVRGLDALLEEARALSWARHGKRLGVYLPGMFIAYGRRGRYPAVSITGQDCAQGCGHCAGKLLETMRPAATPEELIALGRRLWRQGHKGMLLSGGTDGQGRLPWPAMLPAVAELSRSTGLVLTAHVGRIDLATARRLKAAGISQALVDVVGDQDTAREILHLPEGLAGQSETLAAITRAGLDLAPHIILGLHRGRLRGEWDALELLADMEVSRVVFVVFMPLKGTPLEGAEPLPVEAAAGFIASARLRLPGANHHLGCARPRGAYRRELDRLAVAAGINALAIPSDGALDMASELGVKVEHFDTCCSLG